MDDLVLDRAPSLTRSSLAKMFADASVIASGVMIGVITARWLGPAGRGELAALAFLVGLFMHLCSMGLAEAATVFVGQRRAALQQALSATIGALLALAVAGAVALWLVSYAQFASEWDALWPAATVAALGLPLTVHANVLPQFLNIRERFVATSAVLAASSAVTAVATWVLVVLADLHVLGAVLASLLGTCAGLAATGALLSRAGLSLGPVWDATYLSSALAYATRLQVSNILIAVASRVDVLLVYWLADPAAAGRYSVALSVAALSATAPLAISYASFPRLARLGEDDALALTARLFRYAATTTVATGLALAILAPAAISWLFGDAFTPSIVPTIILLAAYALASGQWLLGRAAAARGRPTVLSSSYASSISVMTLFDLLLIPPLGLVGASFAAVIGGSVGLLVCLAAYRRPDERRLGMSAFVPGPGDVIEIVALLRRIVVGWRNALRPTRTRSSS